MLARKPLIGTVSQNVQTHGTGAINIDGCRIEATPEDVAIQRARTGGEMGADMGRAIYGSAIRQPAGNPLGRWPANVALDETAAAQLDRMSGESASVATAGRNGRDDGGLTWNLRRSNDDVRGHSDSGGASRFFYTSKASQTDRDRDMGNKHPTVKPVDLMRWLVRLVTPPGGTVLDPFAGSGSTGVAALGEGFNFIGIELDAEYAAIAKARLESVAPMFAEVTAR